MPMSLYALFVKCRPVLTCQVAKNSRALFSALKWRRRGTINEKPDEKRKRLFPPFTHMIQVVLKISLKPSAKSHLRYIFRKISNNDSQCIKNQQAKKEKEKIY